MYAKAQRPKYTLALDASFRASKSSSTPMHPRCTLATWGAQARDPTAHPPRLRAPWRHRVAKGVCGRLSRTRAQINSLAPRIRHS